MRGLVVCFLLVGVLGALAAVAARAQGQPSISVSPQEGPPGTVVSVTGEGFAPGDTVYIELVRENFPEPIRLATVTADTQGGFHVTVRGLEGRPGVSWQYNVMAYAHSFGNRSVETIAAAPKAIFTVTPGVWPPSGVGAGIARGQGDHGWALAALALAAAFGSAAAVMVMTARPRSGADARG